MRWSSHTENEDWRTKMKKLTVGSLFAGVGGICQGFKNAGFEVSWAVERDEKAGITYRANHAPTLLINQDITEVVDPASLAQVDVLTSGFPCQAFSQAGKRLGFDDPRGNMFLETCRFIKALNPKCVLFENVKGLVNHDKGNTLQTIKQTMDSLGYTFEYCILNSCDFGVKQNRERIFMVGYRKDLGIDGEIRPSRPMSKATFTAQKEVEEKYYYDRFKMYPTLKAEMQSTDTFYQWRRKYVRENKKGLCPTLTANMGTGGHNVPLILTEEGRIRKLTPRECFQLQGFPEDFILPSLANCHLYKQAGNSVTVPVIEALAKGIKNNLKKKTSIFSAIIAILKIF